jgi:hypothetical protein
MRAHSTSLSARLLLILGINIAVLGAQVNAQKPFATAAGGATAAKEVVNGRIPDAESGSRDFNKDAVSAAIDVVSTSPAQDQVSVAINERVSFRFNQDIDPLTVDGASFVVWGSMSGVFSGTFNFPFADVIEFVPDNDYAYGEMIFVALTNAIKGADASDLTQPGVLRFSAVAHDIMPENPGFGEPIVIAPSNGPSQIQTGLIDGDANMDYLMLSQAENKVYVFYGDGTGGITSFEVVADLPNLRYAFLYDEDLDGDLDVRVISDNTLKIYHNEGAGVWTVNFSSTDPTSDVHQYTMADFSADGLVDFIADKNDDFSDVLSYHLNTDNALPPSQMIYEETLDEGNYNYTALCNGDIDQDGDADLIYARIDDMGNTAISWKANDQIPASFPFGPSELVLDVSPKVVEKMCTGDFDNDGWLDIVAVFNDETVHVIYYDADNLNWDNYEVAGGIYNVINIRIIDINNDGLRDILFADERSLYWLKNHGGTDGFTLEDDLFISGHATPDIRHFTLADVDNDNKVDLVMVDGLNNEILYAPFSAIPNSSPDLGAGAGVDYISQIDLEMNSGSTELNLPEPMDDNGDDIVIRVRDIPDPVNEGIVETSGGTMLLRNTLLTTEELSGLTFTPVAGFFGTAAFNYVASDGHGQLYGAPMEAIAAPGQYFLLANGIVADGLDFMGVIPNSAGDCLIRIHNGNSQDVNWHLSSVNGFALDLTIPANAEAFVNVGPDYTDVFSLSAQTGEINPPQGVGTASTGISLSQHILSDVKGEITLNVRPFLPPDGFRAIKNGNDITLEWQESTDLDVAGYRIYRSEDGGVSYPVSYDVNDRSIIDYIDSGVPVNVSLLYYIVSFDAGNVESDSSHLAHVQVMTDNHFGNAIKLDGTGDFIRLPVDSRFDFSANSFSVEVWFKHEVPFTASWQAIVNKHDDTWRLQRYSNTDRLTFDSNHGGSGQDDVMYGNISVNDQRWHHAAIVYDQPANTKYLYVDGQLDNSWVVTDPDPIDMIPSARVHVGRNGDPGMNGRDFEGEIDELRIWNKALNLGDIQSGMFAPARGDEADLLVLYNFDEMDGTTVAYDQSGNGLHGEVVGDTRFIVSERPDNVAFAVRAAYLFNGTADDETGNNNGLILNNVVPAENRFGNSDAAMQFGGTQSDIIDIGSGLQVPFPISVAAWIKPDDVSGVQYFFANDKYEEGNVYSGVMLSVSDGRFGAHFGDNMGAGVNNTYGYRTTNPTVSANNWHHVVAVYHDAATIDLFVDGVQIVDLEQRGSMVPLTLAYNGANGSIGNGSNGNTLPFAGAIDDIYFYNIALEQEDVDPLFFENGWTGVLPTPTGFSAFSKSANEVFITWDHPGNANVAKARFFRNDGTTFEMDINSESDSAFIDNTVAPGTPYTYEMAFLDAALTEGDRSVEKYVMPVAEAGQAMQFDGTVWGELAITDDNTIAADSAFTISFWFKPDRVLNAGDKMMLLQQHTTTVDELLLSVLYTSSNIIQLKMEKLGSGGSSLYITPGGLFKPLQWNHILYTADNDDMDIYLNGRFVRNYSRNGSDLTSLRPLPGNSWYIGKDNDGNELPFEGLLDELVIARDYIDATDVAEATSRPIPGAYDGIFVNYHFNQVDGDNDIFDESTANNNGLIDGASSVFVASGALLPFAPINGTAVFNTTDVELNWLESMSLDVAFLNIYRITNSDAEIPMPADLLVSNVDPVSMTYTDAGVPSGVGLRYFITAVDNNGNEGYFSDPIDVVTTEEGPLYVITANNDGPGSLRQAIAEANSNPGPDTIRFSPAVDWANNPIRVMGSDLPYLTDDSTYIKGDFDLDGRPNISIDGLGERNDGISTSSDNGHKIEGLAIYNFRSTCIDLFQADDITIVSNYFGVLIDGATSADNNGIYGIHGRFCENLQIGDGTATGLNLVSGHTDVGINLYGGEGITILGNIIGLNLAGDAAIPNGDNGINMDGSIERIQVGNGTLEGRNIISGNEGLGLYVDGPKYAEFKGNYIGTDITGTTEFENKDGGIFFRDAFNVTFGGASALERNVCAGGYRPNWQGLIHFHSSDSVAIKGNYLGIGADGTTNLSTERGIYVGGSNTNVEIGGSAPLAGNVIGNASEDAIYIIRTDSMDLIGNLIGVNALASDAAPITGNGIRIIEDANDIYLEDNRISHCSEYGLKIEGTEADSVRAFNNAIFDNTLGAIFIEPGNLDGIVPPRALFLQPDSTLTGKAAANALVQIYEDTGVQGQNYLGTATADPDGDWQYTIDFDDLLDLGFLTALQDSAGNTSAFSGALAAIPHNPLLVTTNADAGIGSLRAAMDFATTQAGPDTIRFEDKGTADWWLDNYIALTAELPTLSSDETFILGDPDTTGVPKVMIVADGVGNTLDHCFKITGADNVIQGLVIGNFSKVNGTGVFIEGTDAINNRVIGCYLGTNKDGAAANANHYGVFIDDGATNNTIGGLKSFERNVISGNIDGGILVRGADTRDNHILNNYIGLKASGTESLNGSGTGIHLFECRENYIGDGSPAGRNIISGNTTVGLRISGPGAGSVFHQISGNYFGLNPTGTAAISNGNGIILSTNAQKNIIGSFDPVAEPNVFSGNGTGINGINSGRNGNIIINNRFGLNATGDDIIGNSNHDIFFTDGAVQDSIVTNLFASDGDYGINLSGSSTDSIYLWQNSIYGHAVSGIILLDNAQDNVAPPRDLFLSSDSILTGKAAPEATIQVFADEANEGQLPVITTSADVAGDWSVKIDLDQIGGLTNLTAIQDSSGFFSAFSVPVSATPIDPLLVTTNADAGIGSLRAAMDFATTQSGPDTIRFDANVDWSSNPIEIVTPLPVLENDSTVILGDFDDSKIPQIEIKDKNGDLLQAFVITSEFNVIQGLVFNNFQSGDALKISGPDAHDNVVTRCYFGSDITGEIEIGNRTSLKISDGAHHNTIGGILPFSGNVFNSHSSNGIRISAGSNDYNEILGNIIGLDKDGDAIVGSSNGGVRNAWGIRIADALYTKIGDGTAAGRNIISGNAPGLDLEENAEYTMVSGNYFGTNKAGDQARANTTSILNGGAAFTLIGSRLPGPEPNIIAGNDGSGIVVQLQSRDYFIGHNIIGATADSSVLGNDGAGIVFNLETSRDTVAYNYIANNNGSAIIIDGADTDSIIVFENSIFDNNDGISIRDNAQANIAAPRDLYYNNEEILSGKSAPEALVRVYADAADQGRYYLTSVEADLSGAWQLSIPLSSIPAGAGFFTATQDSGARTSEFSPPLSNTPINPLLVTTNANAGIGSLAFALQRANTNIGPDTIRFEPAFDWANNPILVDALLPIITDDSTVIIGNVDPGLTPDVTIINNYSGADSDLRYGFQIRSAYNEIRGFIFSGFDTFDDHAVLVYLNDAHFNTIAGNYFGLNADGSVATGNYSSVSIFSGARHNTVGGYALADRNVISGSSDRGIYIEGSASFPTAHNKVINNYIGIGKDGEILSDTQGIGIVIQRADSNSIGDGNAAGRNIIAGNTYGIRISGQVDDPASYNAISGNYIGTKVDGITAVAGDYGIYVQRGDHLLTGNGSQQGRNIIGGASEAGIFVEDSDSVLIAGNFIGIGADGTSNIANASGIWVEGDCDGLQIGDMAYMDRNVISHNSPYGIVATSGADSLLIINNYIGTDSTGTSPAGNSDSGISLSTSYHTIGRPGAGNVISANGARGIFVGTNASFNTIAANKFGTDVTGTAYIGERTVSLIQISNGASHNRIGGVTSDSGNVFVNPEGNGVWVHGTSHHQILSNRFGLSPELGIERGLLLGDDISNGATHNVIANNAIYQANTNGITVNSDLCHSNIFNRNLISGSNLSAISIVADAQFGVQPPVIAAIDADRNMSGFASPQAFVYVYADSMDEGAYFVGSTQADPDGNWVLPAVDLAAIPAEFGRFNALQDSSGNTSAFSASYALEKLIRVAPLSLNFGDIAYNDTQRDTVYAYNEGPLALAFTAINFANPAFAINDTIGSYDQLLPGDSTGFEVTFAPQTPGSYLNQVMTITSNATNAGVVTVNLNGTATNAIPVIEDSLGSLALTEDFDQVVEIAIDNGRYNDPEGDVLSFAISDDPSLVLAELSPASPYELTLNPVPNLFGKDTLVLEITDPHGGTVYDSLFITIAAVNDAPIVANAIDDVMMMDNDQQLFIALLSQVFSDTDDVSLTYSVTDVNRFAAVIRNDSLYFSGIPGQAGIDTVYIHAEDSELLSAIDEVVVNIEPSNLPPVLAEIPAFEINEGDVFPVIDLNAYVNDPNDDPLDLNWKVVTLAVDTLAFAIADDNSLSVTTPNEDYFGFQTVRLVVTDPLGAADSSDVTFSVLPVNDAPVMSAIADTTINFDESISLTLMGSDVDGDALNYSDNSDLTSISGNLLMVSEPGGDARGTHLITVYASDGALLDSTRFTLTIIGDADAPVIQTFEFSEDTSATTLARGIWVNTLAVDTLGGKSGTPSAELRYIYNVTRSADGADLSVELTGSGYYQWTELLPGSYDLAFYVADAKGNGLAEPLYSNTLVVLPAVVQLASETWTMMTLSREVRNNLLFNKLSSGELYRWDGADYGSIPGEILVPGQAFWILTENPAGERFNFETQDPITQDTLKVALNRGWNQVGNPYEMPLRSEFITITANGNADVPLLEAVASEVILSDVFVFTGLTEDLTDIYRLQPIENMIFRPWEGVWIYVNAENAVLTWSKTPVTDIQPLVSSAVLAKREGEAPNRFKVQLEGRSTQVFTVHFTDGPNVKRVPSLGRTGSRLSLSNNLMHYHVADFAEATELRQYGIDVDVKAGDMVTVDFGGSAVAGAYLVFESRREVIELAAGLNVFDSDVQGSGILLLTNDLNFDPVNLPFSAELSQNYPNPFNISTRIRVAVPLSLHQTDVKLDVYNILGQRVATLLNRKLDSGWHTLEWNGKNSAQNVVATGVYFVRMTIAGKQFVKKAVLLK